MESDPANIAADLSQWGLVVDRRRDRFSDYHWGRFEEIVQVRTERDLFRFDIPRGHFWFELLGYLGSVDATSCL
ncbi:MAG: hypothetical protein MI748_04365 [Opitutales bacterium]|nr:hypothetical protein [Opitutales bacterium]